MENSASTNHAALVAIAAEDIHAQQGQPTTTSLLVAQRFKKQHKNVLAAIRNIVKEVPEYGRNYKPIQIDVDLGLGRSRKDPAYLITEMGFTVLAMGFTGKDALHWKIAYSDAFEQMRKTICRHDSLIAPASPLLIAYGERKRKRHAAVYFLQKEDGLIKVGFAVNVASRMKHISAMAGCELTLLATTTGGSKKEAELHTMFAEDRVYGEWFQPSDRLMAYIAGLE